MLRIVFAIFLLALSCRAQDANATNGLLAAFARNGARDYMALPNASLFVASGESCTTFLAPGEFAVELAGAVSVELRGQYTFRALAQGTVELKINGTDLLRFAGNGETSPPSKPIRLNRGTNRFELRFASPKNGDARFQVFWSSRNIPHPVPIPSSALSFDPSQSEFTRASQLREGLRLFGEYRCARCHATETPAIPQLAMPGPDLKGIGSRLNPDWILEQINNPAGRMPRLLAHAPQDAEKIAGFLGTLRGEPILETAGDANKGEQLFGALNCAACHARENLSHVRKKFRPGALAEYLGNPHAHYAWNPMPNFHLNDEEADAIAAFLNSQAVPPAAHRLPLSAEGGELLRTSGCLNCHASDIQGKAAAPNLAEVSRFSDRGCLSDSPAGSTPRFNFRAGEREALTAFLSSRDVSPLARSVPHEFANHQVKVLRCAECHDRMDAVPRLSLLGSKFKPEWSQRLLAGELQYKPRPWMAARMPSFPAHADLLARGLAALHGVPTATPSEKPGDLDMASIGAKLISSAGGFSCVACHAVGSFSAGQVVESPGVNLAYSGERLLKSFFDRWVINPVAIDPSTKMPVYFDTEGRSQLTDILEGDGQKQIDAMWEYLRLGEKMPPPPSP